MERYFVTYYFRKTTGCKVFQNRKSAVDFFQALSKRQNLYFVSLDYCNADNNVVRMLTFKRDGKV